VTQVTDLLGLVEKGRGRCHPYRWVAAHRARLGSRPVLGRPRRRRGALLLAAGVLVAAAGGAVWAGARGEWDERGDTDSLAAVGGDPEAERVLEAVQDATVRASSFRFRFKGVDTTMDFWDDGERRFTGEGAWSPDTWRLVTHDQNDASETIVDGDTVYSRWPAPGDDLAEEPWERWESWEDDPVPRDEVLAEMSAMLEVADAQESELGESELDDVLVDQLAVALAAGLYLDGTLERVDSADLMVEGAHFPGDPSSFIGVIGRGGTPRLLGQAGGQTTFGMTLRAPDEVAAAFERPIPEGQLEVDVGVDDLPVGLRVHVAGTSNAFDLEVRFSDWGSPVDIGLPAA
jgi:hypothetical protein